MQPISSHQLFKTIGNDAKSVSDLQQWVVLVKGRDGKSDAFEVRPPVQPVSGFIGRIMQPAKDAETEQMGIAALASFRDHLVKQFGKEIGETAGQSIRGRVATVMVMREALGLAIDLKEAQEARKQAFESRVQGLLQAPAGEAKSSAGTSSRSPLGQTAMNAVLDRLGTLFLPNAKDRAAIDHLARSAASMIQSLQAMPDPSDFAIRDVLALATLTGNPVSAVQVAKDLCAAPSAGRPGFTGASVSQAETAQFVKGDVTARGKSEIDDAGLVGGRSLTTASGNYDAAKDSAQLHVDLVNEGVKQMSAERRMTVKTPDGGGITLSRQLYADCNRGSYKVNGQDVVVQYTASKEPLKDQFMLDFRAGFPAGPKGDALALLVSGYAHQGSINPMMQFSGVNHDVTPLKAVPDTLSFEAYPRGDGSWTVRCSWLNQFDSYLIPSKGNDDAATQSRCACVGTVTYTIDTSGDTPHLSAVATDLVYSGKVASEPNEPNEPNEPSEQVA